jgi:hypothetical protein
VLLKRRSTDPARLPEPVDAAEAESGKWKTVVVVVAELAGDLSGSI